MPSRWVVCPVIVDGGVRKPKVSTLVDPGRLPVFDEETQTFIDKTYRYSSAVSARGWALCFVTGADLTNLTNDPDVLDLFGQDFDANSREAILETTPRDLSWNNGRLNQLTRALSDNGIDTTGLTLDSTFEEFLFRLGDVHADPGNRGRFNPRKVWAK